MRFSTCSTSFITVICLCATLRAAEPAATTSPTTQAAPTTVPSGDRDPALPAARVELDEWMQHHERLVLQAKQGDIGLYFLGDSITEYFSKAAVWSRYAPYKPGNFGVAGDRTQYVLYRIENGEFEGVHPKVVVLLIGTNSLKKDPADVARGITAVVHTIREKLPETKVLLLGIFPRGAPTEPRRAKLARVNQTISKLDDGRHVRYLDIGPKFLQPDGTIAKDVMEDALHPTEKGYKIWADAMQPLLEEMMK
jgi:lysophospholipase L1-like esterase